MEDRELTRDDLLKVAGLMGAGGMLALGLPGTARAGHGGGHSAYLQAYASGQGDVAGLTLLTQASALSVLPKPAMGGPPALGADAVTGIAGIGFDVELDAAVSGNNKDKNKGRNFSFCLIHYTHGYLNGSPPIGADAVRLIGSVVEAVDPLNVGAPVTITATTGSPVDASHPICLITFDFAGFLFKGRGLAFVNH